MGEIFEQVDLAFECTEHVLLALLVWCGTRWELDLLDGHQETVDGIHAKVNFAKRTGADQGTLDPFCAWLCELARDRPGTVGPTTRLTSARRHRPARLVLFHRLVLIFILLLVLEHCLFRKTRHVVNVRFHLCPVFRAFHAHVNRHALSPILHLSRDLVDRQQTRRVRPIALAPQLRHETRSF